MKRIIMICEGATEQAFARTNLETHFINKDIHLQAPLIKASKGGIVKWPQLKDQIERHLKAEQGAHVTTFIDYYGIYGKNEFPGWDDANAIADKNDRLDSIEYSMSQGIDPELRHRFTPYLQLHEFEGLLFNDIDIFWNQIPREDLVDTEELKKTFSDYPNPEMINNNKETSPSHRLARIIRGYNKVIHGDIISEAIGLTRIRKKCPRFNAWITRLEKI